MKLKISEVPNEPKYRCQYVLTADGYSGDMDSDFHLEESLPQNTHDIECLLDGYDLLKKLKEDRQLKYDVGENHPLYNHPGRESIPLEEYGYHFPEVESFELTWYNESGVPYNVEVLDEV